MILEVSAFRILLAYLHCVSRSFYVHFGYNFNRLLDVCVLVLNLLSITTHKQTNLVTHFPRKLLQYMFYSSIGGENSRTTLQMEP